MIWLQFIISAAIIVYAGSKLTHDADYLSDRLGLGKVWIGVVLLGLVTSLPEAVASLTAIISLEAIDLAVGNMVGSNNFNPILIVVMDYIYRKGSVTNDIHYSKARFFPVAYASILTFIVIVDIGFGSYAIGRLSVGSLVIFICYFWGMHHLSKLHQNENVQPIQVDKSKSLSKIYLNLLFNTVLVVVGAMMLANSAERIAVITGLGQTFVGNIVLALVTSIPEMVVTVSAVRLGSLDLAIGNIFGSNMTNMFIISLCDIFYSKGTVLLRASNSHIIMAVSSLVMTLIIVMGVKQNNKRTFGRFGWDSILLVVCFVVGMSLLYAAR